MKKRTSGSKGTISSNKLDTFQIHFDEFSTFLIGSEESLSSLVLPCWLAPLLAGCSPAACPWQRCPAALRCRTARRRLPRHAHTSPTERTWISDAPLHRTDDTCAPREGPGPTPLYRIGRDAGKADLAFFIRKPSTEAPVPPQTNRIPCLGGYLFLFWLLNESRKSKQNLTFLQLSLPLPHLFSHL